VIRRLRNALRIAWRAFMRFQDHHGPDRAAAVAYYVLLSLVPLLIFLISVGVAVLGSFDAAYRGSMLLVRGVVIHLNQASLDALRSFVEHAARFRWPGLILLAWTSRRIFSSLFSALELVFGVPGRSFAKHNLVALSMVLMAGVALLLTMAMTMLTAGSEGLLLRLRTAGELERLHWVLRNIVPVAVTFAFFFLIYRFVPRRVASPRHAAAGALLATCLWETAKAAFAWYVRNIARYAGIYGTLEGIIVLALWLEISVSIVLYGGEVVALLIHQGAVAAAPTPEAKISRKTGPHSTPPASTLPGAGGKP
jgi:membrane protein